MVIPKKTNFPRFKSGVQHFSGGGGPGGWSNFFEVVGGVGSNWQYLPFLSFFHYVLTPLGKSDGYSRIPSSEEVS